MREGKISRDRRHDAKRYVEKPWRRWYQLLEWSGPNGRRALQLAEHPICQRCEKRGLLVAATVANHVTPHRGDWALFINGPLESTCKTCHDGLIQGEEARGFDNTVGADGFPIDPRHPFNAPSRS